MSTRREVVKRAAELYLEDSESQHGDPELAQLDAELWFRLFRQAEDEVFPQQFVGTPERKES